MESMDITRIMKYLPHRYPFLLIDRVLEIVPNERIVAIKNISMNEPQFPGHFPNHPVMPGVLMIEALAQTAGVLAFRSSDQDVSSNSVIYFVGIDAARFKRPVVPGDQLIFDVEITHAKRNIYKYKARASVDGELAAEAELMCAIKTL